MKSKGKTLLVLFLILILIGAFLFYNYQMDLKEKIEPNEQEIETVKIDNMPEKVEKIYKELTEKCDGTFIWDSDKEEIVINKILEKEACQKENYYSKLIGYTYDKEENLILHVTVLQRKKENLYKLNEELVGKYNTETIDELLDNGSVYEYIYKKNSSKYNLWKVRNRNENG